MFDITTVAFVVLFNTALCAMTTLYSIENAHVSDNNVLLNVMQCGRLYHRFDTAALQFSVGDTSRCDSLKSEFWLDRPVFEIGFGYAVKRKNVIDYSEIGGLFASNDKVFEQRLPFLLEIGVIIMIDRVPYSVNDVQFNIKTKNGATFWNLVFSRVMNTTKVQDQDVPNGPFQNTKTYQGCPLTNGVMHTLFLTLQEKSTLKPHSIGSSRAKRDGEVSKKIFSPFADTGTVIFALRDKPQ